ncbi:MAG: ABC transporter permease subunit [Alphaproteobacteria bacterium]|nr:ABC transporter permease subunit [Alphaproteobacteria bacterium]
MWQPCHLKVLGISMLLFFVKLVVGSLFLLPWIAIGWVALDEVPSTSWGWVPWWTANTVKILTVTAVTSVAIAYPTAWLTTYFRFLGRRWLLFCLMLPLATPGWISAFVYLDLLDDAGVVQQFLRLQGMEWFGLAIAPIDVRTSVAAGVVLGFHLYPYLYIGLVLALSRHKAIVLEAGLALGRSHWWLFFRFGLSVVRPALAVGLTLILLETLNDYGTAQVFAVPTLTTGVYTSWFVFGDVGTAARLSVVLLVMVLLFYLLEQRARRGRSYSDHSMARPSDPNGTHVLRGYRQSLAVVCCSFPVVVGFGFPVGYMMSALLGSGLGSGADSPAFLSFLPNLATIGRAATNTFLLAAVVAAACFVLGVAVSFVHRGRSPALLRFFVAVGLFCVAPLLRTGLPHWLAAHCLPNMDWLRSRWALRSASPLGVVTTLVQMGYAFPGIVLASGLVLLSTTLDDFLYDRGWVLTGTYFLLVVAFVLRYSSVVFGHLDSALSALPRNLSDVAAALGHGRVSTWIRVHLPLLRPSMVAAVVLVMLESVKELPMTLILAPFDFFTLTTLAFQLLLDEQFALAALPSLAVILLGIVPLWVVRRVHP